MFKRISRSFPRVTRVADGNLKNRAPEEVVPPADPESWRDNHYMRTVRANHWASHFCTFAASTALMVGLYAASKDGAWPIVGLMATGTMTGFLWALTITSRAYFWQKHDRIMYRASEQTEIAAVHENLRLKRENDVFFLQLLQRDGLLQDDEEEQAAHSAAIIYLNGNRGRLN